MQRKSFELIQIEALLVLKETVWQTVWAWVSVREVRDVCPGTRNSLQLPWLPRSFLKEDLRVWECSNGWDVGLCLGRGCDDLSSASQGYCAFYYIHIPTTQINQQSLSQRSHGRSKKTRNRPNGTPTDAFLTFWRIRQSSCCQNNFHRSKSTLIYGYDQWT